MSPVVRRLALFALAGSAPACASWRVQGLEPRVVVEREHPDRLRLTRTDSSRTELRQPRVEGDSLVGLAESRPSAVSLDSVAYIELRRQNPAPLYVGAGLGVVGGIMAMLAATWN
ncbi:MAG TPA: hypothetical protein VIG04_05065 [Gemmatimonadales bacterium]|jgi:hypothetical protein